MLLPLTKLNMTCPSTTTPLNQPKVTGRNGQTPQSTAGPGTNTDIPRLPIVTNSNNHLRPISRGLYHQSSFGVSPFLSATQQTRSNTAMARDLSHHHITILCTSSPSTRTNLSVSSSGSSRTPLPATSSSRRTSSVLTTPIQIPTSRVIIDFLMFSLACWTVRK